MHRINITKHVHLSATQTMVLAACLTSALTAATCTNDTDWTGADWTLADGDVVGDKSFSLLFIETEHPDTFANRMSTAA